MSAQPAATHPVFVLLDDAVAGARLFELSSTLAQALRRDLGIVFVESRRSVAAAALPFARVLPYAGSSWKPLSPHDMEQGFRAHAARVRRLAERIALQHRVGWSMRITRGDLFETAAGMQGESDLLLLAGTRIPAPADKTSLPPRRTRVAVLQGATPSDTRALDVATQWAAALAGMLDTVREDRIVQLTAGTPAPAAGHWPDVLVLPRRALSPPQLALLRCPVLLVG